MFSDLIDFLNTKVSNDQIEVKDLHNSCCDSTRTVSDFNIIKTKFFAGKGKDEPRSVAALLFDSKNRLFLLQPCDYYVMSSDLVDIMSLSHHLSSTGEISSKISGTISALDFMMFLKGSTADFSSFFDLKSRNKIQTIILVNLKPQDYLKLRLGSLDRLNILNDHAVLGEVKIIDCQEFKKMA